MAARIKRKLSSSIKYVLGLGALVGGFISIIFVSSPRDFNVSIGDYETQDIDLGGVAHADIPYAQGYYEASYGGEVWTGGEGGGEGEGEGK